MHYPVTILGNHRSTTALIRALIASGLKPDLLVTLGDDARNKAQIASGDATLAEQARAWDIAVYPCRGYRLVADEDRAFFSANSFGIGVCTDWQHLLPGHVLDAFSDGVFGFHGSLMRFPNGRGRSPFNWSLRLGGKSIFHNCFRYTEGADDGGVFNTTEIMIEPTDTIASLQFKALIDSQLTIRHLLHAWQAGDVALTPQSDTASVWLPKLTPRDSLIAFAAMDLAAIVDVIRASSRPFAGAYAERADGGEVRLWSAAPYAGPTDPEWAEAAPGQVLEAALGAALIKCRDGLLFASDVSGDIATARLR